MQWILPPRPVPASRIFNKRHYAVLLVGPLAKARPHLQHAPKSQRGKQHAPLHAAILKRLSARCRLDAGLGAPGAACATIAAAGTSSQSCSVTGAQPTQAIKRKQYSYILESRMPVFPSFFNTGFTETYTSTTYDPKRNAFKRTQHPWTTRTTHSSRVHTFTARAAGPLPRCPAGAAV